MDIDELKNKWQDIDCRTEKLEEENLRLSREIAAGKITGSKEKLTKSFKGSLAACFFLPILAPFTYKVMEMPLWFSWAYAIFGIIMGIFSLVICFRLRKIDLSIMSVLTAFEESLKIKQTIFYARLTGIVTGGILLTELAAVILFKNNDLYMQMGFVGGLVVGLGIGIYKIKRQHSLMRQIIDELQQCK